MRTTLALSFAAAAQALHDTSAPASGPVEAQIIPDSYIITFKKHIDDTAALSHHSWIQELHDTHGQQERLELRKRGDLSTADVFTGMKHIYNIGVNFRGYAGHFRKSTVDEIRKHSDVAFVEPDTVVRVMHPVETEHVSEDKCSGDLENSAPWGLARISHRNHLNFGTFNKYLYAADGGEGVDAYVVDTGCNTEHVDFEGRAEWGKTIPTGDADEDGNGHGTHVSGTIVGKKYGVAKKANIRAVKVLRSNGAGSMSDVVKGVDFAAQSHLEQVEAAKKGKRKGFKGSVANMSLGGGKSPSLDLAVNSAVEVGVHFAVAAGNDNADACNYSPAAAEGPLTVGATDLEDARAYFSNYGTCTDIFAPGLNILSTWIGSKYAVNTISGTSMASPHVCGLLAYYLSLQPAADSEYAVGPMTPRQLKDNMISIATRSALSGIPDKTPNLLAWNGGGCGNFSQIFKAGGYEVKGAHDGLNGLNELEHLGEAAKDQLVLAKVWGTKAEKLSKKIHDVVEHEIDEVFSEL